MREIAGAMGTSILKSQKTIARQLKEPEYRRPVLYGDTVGSVTRSKS